MQSEKQKAREQAAKDFIKKIQVPLSTHDKIMLKNAFEAGGIWADLYDRKIKKED